MRLRTDSSLFSGIIESVFRISYFVADILHAVVKRISKRSRMSLEALMICFLDKKNFSLRSILFIRNFPTNFFVFQKTDNKPWYLMKDMANRLWQSLTMALYFPRQFITFRIMFWVVCVSHAAKTMHERVPIMILVSSLKRLRKNCLSEIS